MRKKSAARRRLPRISDAEWIVMRVMWERAPVTANGVVDALAGQVDWKPKTVHTLIRRLVDKGALEYRKRGREYVYQARVGASDCEHAESRSFLDRVFGGKIAPFLATFVEREEFTAEEVEELRRILERGAAESKSAAERPTSRREE